MVMQYTEGQRVIIVTNIKDLNGVYGTVEALRNFDEEYNNHVYYVRPDGYDYTLPCAQTLLLPENYTPQDEIDRLTLENKSLVKQLVASNAALIAQDERIEGMSRSIKSLREEVEGQNVILRRFRDQGFTY